MVLAQPPVRARGGRVGIVPPSALDRTRPIGHSWAFLGGVAVNLPQSNRLAKLPPYLFADLRRKMAEARAKGIE